MKIKCKHWKASDTFFRGTCELGLYKGKPSYGHCVNLCGKSKTTKEELAEYIQALPKETNEPTKEEKQAENKMPGILGMSKTLLGKHRKKVVKHGLKTGRWLVTHAHQIARLAVCGDCDKMKMVKGKMRCTDCGCKLGGDLGRLKFEALPCDLGKHDEVDNKLIGHLKAD